MRLINVQTGRLEEFFHEPPPYAVLSHTWGSDEEEISFRDIQEGNEVFKTGIGRDKFDGFCEQALADELDYAWMDTCCIDKTNSTELSEAINSMFTWYQKADVCYAFLADVSSIDDPSNAESQFRRSRWFERGWTLQELLAPSRVRFYNRDWSLLGTKRQLSTVVAQTTGIPRPFLLGTADLREASVAQRMSWAANRVTKRKEDIAYCLLGIFGVNLPMIYGEGDQAFARLQEEIMRRNTDDSILAWNLNSTESTYDDTATVGGLSGGILAASPFDFATSGDIVCREHRGTSIDPLYVFGGHLRIRLRLYKTAENQTFGLLDCHAKDNVQSVVGIPLLRIQSDGSYDEYVRPEGQQGRLLDVMRTEAPPQLVHICRNGQNQTETSTSRRYGFYVEESVHETGLELFDVEPRDRWEKDNATINTTVDFGLDQVQRSWIRFRYKKGTCGDYVVMLELEVNQSRVHACCHVMTASRDTSLQIIASKIFETNPHTFGKQSASNGVSNLRVSLDEERVGACQMFVVRLASMSKPPRVNVNVSLELAQLERQVYLSDLLYEDRAIGPERANLSRLAWEKAAIVEKHKTKIAAIQTKLDRLQLEKKTLNAGLSALVRDIDQLHVKDQTLKERRSALSEAVTHAQDVLSRLDKESISQWYGLMVGSLVKSTLPVESRIVSSVANESKRLLLQAVLEGHEATVQFLLDRGSKVELTDDEGRSLLRIATSRGHEGLMKMLVERGADTESVNQHGITPLLEATFQGNASAVGLLLDVKAQINAKDKNGQSPLSIAALKGHFDVARLLLDRRSDIKSKDKDGRDPLHVAVANGHNDLVDLLLLRGADIETATESGQTPLSLSSMLGKEAMTRHLLGNGASVHARDANGWTPLFHATLKGHDEIMKLLIQNGADINAKDTKEQSLLHVAIENGQKSAETILVERGATAEKAGGKGKSLQMFKENHRSFTSIFRGNRGSTDSLISEKQRVLYS
ncbi:Vegetative incompatibility protein HET-E-1 [Colletotrichum siamense]|nr:Vegetative incompatibility protein HET-E-1 [Colletotrichum siamense]